LTEGIPLYIYSKECSKYKIYGSFEGQRLSSKPFHLCFVLGNTMPNAIDQEVAMELTLSCCRPYNFIW